MHDTDNIERELREQYPRPSDAATERARAAVMQAATEQPRPTRRWRGLAGPFLPVGRRRSWKPVLGVAVAAAALVGAAAAGAEAFPRNNAPFPTALHFSKAAAKANLTATKCPDHTGTGAFVPTLSSSSGSPGSTVTVAGPLPVRDESGADVGSTATEVIAYWNLDLNKWDTALTSPLSPASAVAGSPVELLGTQNVAGVCNYAFQVKIPSSAPAGTYPIQVLFESSDTTGVTTGPMPPTNYQVTVG